MKFYEVCGLTWYDDVTGHLMSLPVFLQDLDAYRDDEEHHNLSNDSGAASYWEEPAGGEGLPPYEPPHSRDLEGEGPEEPLNPPSLDRGGGSFMSAAMFNNLKSHLD